MTREELVEFLHEHLGICGCSDNDHAPAFLKDLLEVGEMRDQGHEAEAQALLDSMLKQGDCISRNLPIYWITAAGLIEHGWSMDTYGLSDIGEAVLGALRDYGTGDSLFMSEQEPTKAEAPPVEPPPGTVWN